MRILHMKNQEVQVAIMGEIVFSSTDYGVDLVSLCAAGNIGRLQIGKPVYQLNTFLKSDYLKEYIKAAAKVWGIPEDSFLVSTGKLKKTRHYGHVSIAVLLAEQLSPEFHAKVHKTFIEGEILEYRVLGGDTYKLLNNVITQYLPSPSGDNTGRYITVAKLLRDKCILSQPEGEEGLTWNQSVADSTSQRMRYDLEAYLVKCINLGMIRDFDHLKEVIQKL
jgi:hypothetical protein